MFEGKHIHFSPTDNKPLCSYSGKICRQRRLNGYAFCIRHILEDKSAPFKQCSYVTRNNSQKCLNAIPANQDRGYCHSHMQVVGIIPKTERKTKVQPAQKDSSSHATEKFSVSNAVNGKKDPGAVFRFEEDSSDITDVFSYKNGLTNGSLNGKGKTTKARDTATNAAKEAKYVKSQNGTITNPATFTTKKITDKNRNVYTTIVPATCNGSSKVNLKNSSSNSSTEINSTTAQHKSSSRVVQLSIRVQTESSRGSELKSYDVEEVRQFEQLKTLKQLDKSSLSDSVCEEKSENAKLTIFPRFAAKHSGISSSWTTKSKDSCSEDRKSEIVYNPPPPPLITRSNNGIIIKTEPQAVYIHENSEIKDDKNLVGKQPSGGVLYLSGNNNNNSSSSNANSIENRDLKNRHDFLAHVRNTFKSQYKTIKKACKVSEKCERNTKRKLANSILQCIRIDSSICAQVLLGFDLKIPSTGTGNDDDKDVGKKTEYDDYEFFDNDSPSVAEDYKNTKNSGSVSKKNCGKDLKTVDNNNSKVVKSKAQRRSPASGVKSKQLESCSSESFGAAENDAHNGSTAVPSKTKSHKANKRVEKSKPAEVTKESKFTPVTSSKKKLKRADAMLVSSDDSSASNIINETIKDVSEGISSVNSSSTATTSLENIVGGVGKKRRLEIDTAKNGAELCLSLNGHSPPGICSVAPAFDMSDHITASAHIGLQGKIKVEGRSQSTHLSQKLNQGVGNPLNDVQELQDMLHHSQLSSATSHRNQGLETVLNSVGSSENAGTPDGVITDASFDSTFEHSTSSQPDCDFSEDDLEHSFELQIDPEIESQASRLLEDNVLTEADFTELFPDNRMSDHKLGRNDLQELGLEFDVNDIDYSLFANIFPNFPRTSQPESISISNQF
ncbi:INO80 complex subunit D [Orchesella cincta]|uniref:INO80 complex subunit D n=1 Tax=Orchesella cincta TaxID=48709 RepID=A0A1D2N1R0_ORCCI|nr:INO80 complex subunit D [Orchesella cincta]